jgi:hypothetical protein
MNTCFNPDTESAQAHMQYCITARPLSHVEVPSEDEVWHGAALIYKLETTAINCTNQPETPLQSCTTAILHDCKRLEVVHLLRR